MPVTVTGRIDDKGKLVISDRSQLDKWIETRKNKNVVIVFDLFRKKRSNRQNAYYWGVLVEMLKDGFNALGNEFTAEDVHDFIKKEFNYKEVINKETGEVVRVPQSTTSLTTVDFMILVAKVQRFAANMLGIYIPDPNEETMLEFSKTG